MFANVRSKIPVLDGFERTLGAVEAFLIRLFVGFHVFLQLFRVGENRLADDATRFLVASLSVFDPHVIFKERLSICGVFAELAAEEVGGRVERRHVFFQLVRVLREKVAFRAFIHCHLRMLTFTV